MSQVRLRGQNIQPLLSFYQEILGLQLVRQTESEAALSGGGTAPIIELVEDVTAAPRLPQAVGLFHLAIRYPNRLELARACLSLANRKYPLDGASDHNVSEAVYLRDPDGNGVELYVDRPSSQWIWHEGEVTMATTALDLEGLLAAANDESERKNSSSRLELGHIHLRVRDLAQAERFYHSFLGLAVTQRSYPGALFFSAGGYHHHVAVNTWGSPTPPPLNSYGLISYRLVVPEREILYCLKHRAPLLGYESETVLNSDQEEILRLRDPSGNWVELQASNYQ
jgi:catechol 2,3-dioxygenase